MAHRVPGELLVGVPGQHKQDQDGRAEFLGESGGENAVHQAAESSQPRVDEAGQKVRIDIVMHKVIVHKNQREEQNRVYGPEDHGDDIARPRIAPLPGAASRTCI